MHRFYGQYTLAGISLITASYMYYKCRNIFRYHGKCTSLLLCNGITAIIQKCLSLQEKAIKDFSPDIVVGSSFGGGIAVLSLMNGTWTGPTILLAPAAAQLARRSYYINEDQIKLPDRVPIRMLSKED